MVVADLWNLFTFLCTFVVVALPLVLVWKFRGWKDSSIEEREEIEPLFPDFPFDPLRNDVLERFEQIKSNTGCLFARQAKIWSTPKWDENISVEENTKRLCIPVLSRFCSLIKEKRRLRKKDVAAGDAFCREFGLEALVVECAGRPAYGSSVSSLSDTFRRFAQVVSDNDPFKSNFMKVSPLVFPSWNFLFDDEAFFITTFAHCYPPTHPRYSYGVQGVYILLQPEESFVERGITVRGLPGSIRWKIRENFKKKGQPYEHNEPRSAPVAWWFVRPLDIGQDQIIDREKHGIPLEENEFGEPFERGYTIIDWYSPK